MAILIAGCSSNRSGQRHIDRFYSGIEDLWDRHLDGLIVTGTEPRASEPDGRTILGEPDQGFIEWAERNTRSTIWSCLAAHAALLHIDGIARRRLSEQALRTFRVRTGFGSPMASRRSAPIIVPHSRWNDVPEDELTACGYCVLTRAQDAGVDIFMKQRKSLFVFLQGHPEYEANTLLWNISEMSDVSSGERAITTRLYRSITSTGIPWLH